MGWLTIIILIGISVLLVFWGVSIYNRLIALRQAAKNSWAQIDVQLKRRKDLIPNLINAVKGYMTHEAGTLEAVVSARAKALQAGPLPTTESIKAEGELSTALSRLMSVTESYPDLKANTNVQGLMEELTSTENKISFARQGYNGSVEELNTRIESIPDTWVNRFAKVEPMEMWKVTDEQRAQMEEEPPEVKF